MTGKDYLPDREAELITWIGTFNGLISTGFATYGLSSAQATNYGTLATAFQTAYATAQADTTRSPANIVAKNTAKKAVIDNTRMLVAIIQSFPGTTDEMRTQLGITVRATPSPIGIPTSAPAAEVRSRTGTMVRYHLHDSVGIGPRPAGVDGAYVYTFVGAVPPADITDWDFQGEATRQFVEITYPADTAPGTLVWFTAQWRNPRGQTGPACSPISTNIAGGAITQSA